MPVLNLSNAAIHYREAGAGQPVLLLHANPGDSRDFEAVMPLLARHYRVIAPDWPGYGQSAFQAMPEPLGALVYRGILREFLEALALSEVILIGNSLGGNAAAGYALEHPERVKALVLVSPGGFTPHNIITRRFCRWQGSRFAMPPAWFARLYLRKRTPVTRAMLARAAGEQAAPERLHVNRAVWRSFAEPSHDLRPVAGQIRQPTLLIFGKGDPVIPARVDGKAAQRVMPDATYVEMPCGHAPFAEIPESFVMAVEAFLRGPDSEADGKRVTAAVLSEEGGAAVQRGAS